MARWDYPQLYPDDSHVHEIAPCSAYAFAQARPTMFCIPLVYTYIVRVSASITRACVFERYVRRTYERTNVPTHPTLRLGTLVPRQKCCSCSGRQCPTGFALHLSRPHQRHIKYFTSTAFFELAWEG